MLLTMKARAGAHTHTRERLWKSSIKSHKYCLFLLLGFSVMVMTVLWKQLVEHNWAWYWQLQFSQLCMGMTKCVEMQNEYPKIIKKQLQYRHLYADVHKTTHSFSSYSQEKQTTDLATWLKSVIQCTFTTVRVSKYVGHKNRHFRKHTHVRGCRGEPLIERRRRVNVTQWVSKTENWSLAEGLRG